MTRPVLAAGILGTLLLLANVSDANAFSGHLHDSANDVVDLTSATGAISTQ